MTTSSEAVHASQGKSKSGVAITALVLGIVAISGSPLPILNNATAIAGFLGVLFGIIGLFGSRKITALVGLVLAIAGVVITLALQAQWSKDLDEIGKTLEQPFSTPTAETASNPG